MNAPARPAVPRQTDPTQERGNPGDDPVPHEPYSDGHIPPWDPSGPNAPDEGAFETFVGGAGI
jgi:hypothetical protein